MQRRFKMYLVTGAPRCGTTAVGKILAMASNSALIYEPFNATSGLQSVEREFEVPGIDGFDEDELRVFIKNTKNKNLNFKRGFRNTDTPLLRLFKYFVGARGRWSYLKYKFKKQNNNVIWKDPLAVFFSQALVENHKIPVICTLRSPLGMSASFKRLGWFYKDIKSIYSRVVKVNPNVQRVEQFLNDRRPSVNALVVWVLVYDTILKWHDSSHTQKFIIWNTEKAAQNPHSYRLLFNNIDLNYSLEIQRKIVKFHSGDSKKNSDSTHDFKRDTKYMLNYYRTILSDEEIEIISNYTCSLYNEIKSKSLNN